MKSHLQELPALYMREGKQLLLVNYRVKGNYLIVDLSLIHIYMCIRDSSNIERSILGIN